jgi:hypothetical protein
MRQAQYLMRWLTRRPQLAQAALHEQGHNHLVDEPGELIRAGCVR